MLGIWKDSAHVLQEGIKCIMVPPTPRLHPEHNTSVNSRWEIQVRKEFQAKSLAKAKTTNVSILIDSTPSERPEELRNLNQTAHN